MDPVRSFGQKKSVIFSPSGKRGFNLNFCLSEIDFSSYKAGLLTGWTPFTNLQKINTCKPS